MLCLQQILVQILAFPQMSDFDFNTLFFNAYISEMGFIVTPRVLKIKKKNRNASKDARLTCGQALGKGLPLLAVRDRVVEHPRGSGSGMVNPQHTP